MKRIISVIVVIAMILGSVASVYANDSLLSDFSDETNAQIANSADYPKLSHFISDSNYSTSISFDNHNCVYYWGDDYFVVKDNSQYYLVELNDTYFTVNGEKHSIIHNQFSPKMVVNPNRVKSVTLPTPWTTVYYNSHSFDVGGTLISIAVGLIVGYCSPAFASSVSGIVASSLSQTFISGILPENYSLTISQLKKCRTLQYGVPTIAEFYEENTVCGGLSSNNCATTLHYGTITYTEEYWD